MRISLLILMLSVPALAGEATFLSPDCHDCQPALTADGARVGNRVGVQNTPAPVPAAPTVPAGPPPGAAPARR